MKVVRVLLGLVAGLILLAGSFTAGTFISQTRASVQQFAQPTFIPQGQIQRSIMRTATVKWISGKQFIGIDSTQHSVILSTPDEGVGIKPSDLLLIAVAS